MPPSCDASPSPRTSLPSLPPLHRGRYPGEILRRLRQEPLAFLAELGALYPQACRLRILGREVWLLFLPDLARQLLTGDQRLLAKGRALQRTSLLLGNGLLTAEGADHMRQRRALQPVFHKRRLEGYAQVMAQAAERCSTGWLDGEKVEVHSAMMELALSVVSRTILGTDLEAHQSRISGSLEEVLRQFGLLTLPFFELFQHLPLPPVRRFRRSRNELFAVVDEVIAAHARGETGPDSMLSLLDHLPPERVRDEVLTMLLAGHETTANLLTFALDLLARHPQEAEPFYREVRGLLSERRSPLAGDYAALPVTRRVVQEALRLYPPAWVVGRRNLQELSLGSYRVPTDTLMLAPQCVIHRDARYFSEPDQFWPDRWLQGEGASAFFPFGGGTRICIGEGFARMEAVLALAVLGRDWSFQPVRDGAPALSAGITLRPRDGLPLRVRRASM